MSLVYNKKVYKLYVDYLGYEYEVSVTREVGDWVDFIEDITIEPISHDMEVPEELEDYILNLDDEVLKKNDIIIKGKL